MKGPRLSPKFQVKSFLASGQSLETPVEPHFYNAVKSALVDLLGAQSYFASRVLTPYCYTIGTYYSFLFGPKIVQLSISYTNTCKPSDWYIFVAVYATIYFYFFLYICRH